MPNMDLWFSESDKKLTEMIESGYDGKDVDQESSEETDTDDTEAQRQSARQPIEFQVDEEVINSNQRQKDNFNIILEKNLGSTNIENFKLEEQIKYEKEIEEIQNNEKPLPNIIVHETKKEQSSKRLGDSLKNESKDQTCNSVSSVSKRDEHVFSIPVAEMPSPTIYGERDPLEGSPIRHLTDKIMIGGGIYEKLQILAKDTDFDKEEKKLQCEKFDQSEDFEDEPEVSKFRPKKRDETSVNIQRLSPS